MISDEHWPVSGNQDIDGYWCVVCARWLKKEDGVVSHDDIPHPSGMTFDEEEKPQ